MRPQSRAMSVSSVDDGDESDQYYDMSPVTPTVDGEDRFWAGESCHWFLICR